MSVREGSDTPRARQTVQIEARVGRRASLECFEVAPGTGSGVAVDHGREEPVRQPRKEGQARARAHAWRDAMAYLVALRTRFVRVSPVNFTNFCASFSRPGYCTS